MDPAHRSLIPDFIFFFFSPGGGINCISYDMRVYHFRFCFVFSPGVSLQSDWSLSVTTDLTMLVV